MELEKMKVLWANMRQNDVIQNDILSKNINDMTQLKLNEESKNFKIAEISGLLIAYVMAGIILYKFNILDNWYLITCGIILVLYFICMPLFTLTSVKRMKRIDLAKLNYREVLEHFYSVKSRLKQAEKISLWASPFLFISAAAIITKIFLQIDLFTYSFKLPVVLLSVLSFTGAFLFNIWTYNKRDRQLLSVRQLLEEDISKS